VQAAMKILINSAYGYMGAGAMALFADRAAADEVTRRGREILDLVVAALRERGMALLEADTDGVYFAVPDTWTEEDERRVVNEVAALLPPLVQLEFDGRYAAMLSHEPKNYALVTYDGTLVLRGVAFRSSRSEPFGDAFLRQALSSLLRGDVSGVRDAFVLRVRDLRSRRMEAFDVSSRVRLTKTPEQYAAVRETRRELAYEAMLAAGRTVWTSGERVRVYRTQTGHGALVADPDDEEAIQDGRAAARDYDVEYYVRLLRDTFAARFERALTPEDFDAVFADPDQPSLFARRFDLMKPLLNRVGE
jgi:DNA polymerase elongation subunit (family B)